MKIFLFSKDGDRSSNLVTDWLSYYGHQIIRINNYHDFFQYFSKILIDHHLNSVSQQEEFGIWIRRRGVIAIPNIEDLGQYQDQLSEHLKDELLSLFQYTLKKLHKNSIKKIGSPNGSRLNKLEVLDLANSIGLKIPATCITNNKTVVKAFNHTYSAVITKSIAETTMFMDKKGNKQVMYTSACNEQIIESHSTSFFPSLFQESIQKAYEIRTYYLNGICYSMAIFSQQSKLSSIDFRMYDTVNKVRNVPFQLPNNISKKVKLLMKQLGLNEGSIDFIMSTTNEIIFLEVNPAGQFGMVSKPCNYYLQEKIATYYHE